MVLRSAHFDDIYFSAQDGLAETRHVFLAGNNLPAAWQGRTRFVIGETGFGTGLNFLAAWTLFEKTTRAGQTLHYISFEKYPLSWDEISRALMPWRTEFGGRIDRLRALYPLRVPGFHRLMLNDQVTLTLVFDDVQEALPQTIIPGGVDAWFLDGFAPAKNPQMWTPDVFGEIARLSHAGTTCSTFTVARVVRDGLAEAGFATEKRPGYGRKRDMLAGTLQDGAPVSAPPSRKCVAIIGAGLAGTAAAYVLKRSGQTPVIFEQGSHVAPGASGNPEGLYNPRLSAQRSALSDLYTAGWAQAVRGFADVQRDFDIRFNPCGTLHLATDADREKKFKGALDQWGWHRSHMHWLEPAEAARRAGLALAYPALYLPAGGTVSPARLCAAWAIGVDVRFQTPVQDIGAVGARRIAGEDFDAVILACGAAVKTFAGFENLPINNVRGQLTEIRASPSSYPLQTNLCYGGYLSPQQNGVHRLGATFQPWREDAALHAEDDAQNLAGLDAVMPGLGKPEIVGGRVGFRTSSRDRFPVVGAHGDDLFVSTAHGSHGLVSALAGAHLLADMLTKNVYSLSRDTVTALAPDRFERREQARAGSARQSAE